MTDTTSIALNKLTAWEGNVRKTEAMRESTNLPHPSPPTASCNHSSCARQRAANMPSSPADGA